MKHHLDPGLFSNWKMRIHRHAGICCIGLLWLAGGCLSPGKSAGGQAGGQVSFKKQVLTTDFIAEGAAVGDVNRDGKNDVLAGDFLFEAHNWEKHELAQPQQFFYD